MAATLTPLLKGKPQNLQWNPEAQQAFGTLKQRFVTTLILCHPDP